MQHPKTPKILMIAPAWVGDAVMSQVVIGKIHQHSPACTIDILAHQALKDLYWRMAGVRKIHTHDLKHGVFQLKERLALAKKIRAEAYDHAIVLPNSWKSALIPFFAKIPHRQGWLGEMRYGLLNDYEKLNKKKYPLMVQRFARLAIINRRDTAPLENNSDWEQTITLQIDEDQAERTSEKFDLPQNNPLLFLCPGAEYGPAKQWPANHFAAVAEKKLAENYTVCIVGGPKDRSIAKKINQLTKFRCRDFTGKTTLGEAIDLLSFATAVVTNDSGLMHVAAALHKPLVALYGSSSPQFTPPLNQKKVILSLDLPCSPCFKRECPLGHLKCLQELLPQQVLTALTEMAP